jgi:hypothetical protein
MVRKEEKKERFDRESSPSKALEIIKHATPLFWKQCTNPALPIKVPAEVTVPKAMESADISQHCH